MDFYQTDLSQLHDDLKNKKISATELTKETFDHIKKNEDQVKAFITLNEEAAMKKAAEIDQQGISEDQLTSGIPLAVKDNILILGFGNIGFTCLLALLKLGYTKISVFTRSINVDINALKEKYKVEVNFVNKISNSYATYIDTTGSSDIIKNVIEQDFSMRDILILSTPRESTYFIDPLIINRKNLTIIGGHELNGIDKKWRNNLFKKILKENTELENILNTYISITAYSKSNVRKLIDNKKALIDIIQY